MMIVDNECFCFFYPVMTVRKAQENNITFHYEVPSCVYFWIRETKTFYLCNYITVFYINIQYSFFNIPGTGEAVNIKILLEDFLWQSAQYVEKKEFF